MLLISKQDLSSLAGNIGRNEENEDLKADDQRKSGYAGFDRVETLFVVMVKMMVMVMKMMMMVMKMMLMVMVMRMVRMVRMVNMVITVRIMTIERMMMMMIKWSTVPQICLCRNLLRKTEQNVYPTTLPRLPSFIFQFHHPGLEVCYLFATIVIIFKY